MISGYEERRGGGYCSCCLSSLFLFLFLFLFYSWYRTASRTLILRCMFLRGRSRSTTSSELISPTTASTFSISISFSSILRNRSSRNVLVFQELEGHLEQQNKNTYDDAATLAAQYSSSTTSSTASSSTNPRTRLPGRRRKS